MGCKGSRVQISALRPVKTNGSEISVAKPVAKFESSADIADILPVRDGAARRYRTCSMHEWLPESRSTSHARY
jgi:hypothetical protein